MSRQPAVSVLLANWNGGRFLEQAIESVVRQTFTDWVLIAVDTGSTDSSPAILQRWAVTDQRIQPLLIPQRMSYPEALNLGLAQAQGDFVARIESDDVWLPARLHRQMEFYAKANNEKVGVCGTDAVLIDESGRQLGLKQFPRLHEECLRAIWYRNPFCNSSVLIRKAALEDCGRYDPGFYMAEDLELWFRLGRRWALRNLNEALVHYRIWPQSTSSKKLAKVAWLCGKVRRRAARELGYPMPWLAHVYAFASLGTGLLPPLLARRLFECAVRLWNGRPGAKTAPDGNPTQNKRMGVVKGEDS